MLAVASVLCALPDLEAIGARFVAVAATWTTCALVMDSQLYLANRTFGLNDRSDRSLGMAPQGIVHDGSAYLGSWQVARPDLVPPKVSPIL
jgi:hypothetical protein